MKTKTLLILFTAVVFVSAAFKTISTAPFVTTGKDLKEAVGQWEFIAGESTIGFKIDNFWWASVSGTMAGLKGTAHIKEPIASSSVELSLDVNTVNTGMNSRDKHLKTPDFFEVATYPSINFKCSQVTEVNKEFRYLLKGDLTIKGKTKATEVPFDFSGIENGKAVFSGKVMINKKDFALDDFKGMGMGDVATVTFTVKARKSE